MPAALSPSGRYEGNRERPRMPPLARMARVRAVTVSGGQPSGICSSQRQCARNSATGCRRDFLELECSERYSTRRMPFAVGGVKKASHIIPIPPKGLFGSSSVRQPLFSAQYTKNNNSAKNPRMGAVILRRYRLALSDPTVGAVVADGRPCAGPLGEGVDETVTGLGEADGRFAVGAGTGFRVASVP